ncbi:hypothetical protein [Halococcus sediminicola]|uniref:hypothetical protein n=1 Tax=Halococcus sediminicola TaxID=1264579 RepID=UPI000678B8C4|nr:hypothetical protein [Halococcus sediminicola]
MSDDDDGFVFGDDDDGSLFGSVDSLERGSERRFGTDDSDSAAAGRSVFEGTTAMVAAVVVVVVLVAVGTVAYPLVLDALDTGGATDGRAPSDGDSAGVSTPATPTEPPVTKIVMTVTESAAAPESGQATTSGTTRSERTASSNAEPTPTERPTASAEEFPAGESADGTDTADGA